MLGLVTLLFAANTINIGADIAAMGSAAELVVGRGGHVFTVLFAVVSLLLQMFVPYRRYSGLLKWVTLSLLAYVALLFMIKLDWAAAVKGLVWTVIDGKQALVTIVAIFGTTISPYLFFWQSAQEVEEVAQNEGRGAAGRRALASAAGVPPDQARYARRDGRVEPRRIGHYDRYRSHTPRCWPDDHSDGC